MWIGKSGTKLHCVRTNKDCVQMILNKDNKIDCFKTYKREKRNSSDTKCPPTSQQPSTTSCYFTKIKTKTEQTSWSSGVSF